MDEQKLTHDIVAALVLIPGVYAWRNNVGVSRGGGRYVRYGIVGQADITGICRNGKRLELEVKLPGGKHEVSEQQLIFGERILRLGGIWAVVRSVEGAISIATEGVGL